MVAAIPVSTFVSPWSNRLPLSPCTLGQGFTMRKHRSLGNSGLRRPLRQGPRGSSTGVRRVALAGIFESSPHLRQDAMEGDLYRVRLDPQEGSDLSSREVGAVTQRNQLARSLV